MARPESQRQLTARARIAAGEGFIYCARFSGHPSFGKDTPFIKIGFSLTPEKRVTVELGKQNRYLNPELLAVMPGSLRDEQALHKALVGHAINGREFYAPSILSHPAIPAELRSAP